ncbi:RecT family recombinase [Paenibacillus graminis]|uniref:Recombinase n=1 Tax=Paenibacillus graminis TaxID=189425 RepID=A0A089M8D6_9BACL|nr:RecT family recombinase [Paenibacillus graminis]AIQ69502.1 recombinase [Paenibacillus graminis]
MTVAIETQVQETLDRILDSKHDALPSDFKKKRFSENCKVYVAEEKDLHKYTIDDIVANLFKGAVLGLDFLAKECHLITGGVDLKFQTDYKGEMKLTKKYSVRPMLDVYAKNVREGDIFREQIIEGRPAIHFDPLPFNASKIIGSFAIALFQDGGMVYESIPAGEIEEIRKNYGKSLGDAWEKSQGEMYKRTVLRRLCKTIETDFDAEQRLIYEMGGAFEFTKQPTRSRQQSPFNPPEESEVIQNDRAAETDQG